MLAITGFLMIGIIVYLLLQSKTTPTPIFAIIPIIAALITGSSFAEITKYISQGVGTTWPVAILFMFSVIYFSVMNDAGLFDPLVNYLAKKAGNSVVAVTVVTAIIATIAHLDGALAATLLVTVPAMLPLYKRMNIRPVVMLAIIGAAMSIMNLLPWGGPVARIAAITKTDINELWQMFIPLQIVGIFIVLAFAAFMGIMEKRRGAGLGYANAQSEAEACAVKEVDAKAAAKAAALKRPKLVWFNALLTVGVILLMCFTKIPLYAAFMIGLSIALLVNYPKISDQNYEMKTHAANALQMATILISSGVFLGVLSGAKMMDAMATSLLTIIPSFVGPYLHIVLGVFGVPIGMLLGTDSYFFGLVPLAMSVGEKFAVDPSNMARALLITKNFGVLTTPHAATTYLAIGLAGIELKELLYFCMPRLWLLSLISLFAAIVLGIVVL